MLWTLAGQSNRHNLLLLPLLCSVDTFSLSHYWEKWCLQNLKYLLPGVVLRVIAGVQLMGRMELQHFNVVIGSLAVGFVESIRW